MTDIAVLGFRVDTRSLDAAKVALGTVEIAARGVGLAVEEMEKVVDGAFRIVETTADRMNRAVVAAFKALGYAVTEPQQAFARLSQSAEDAKRKLENINGTINALQLMFYAATGRIKDFAIEGGMALGDMEKRASKLAESMTLLQKGLALAGVGVGVGALMKYTDEYGRMGAQLSQVTKSTREYEDTQRALYQQAQQTGQSVADSAKLYSTMARATQELNVSSSQLLDVTGMVNKMLMTAQLPAESASAALFQFSQGMAAGTLRGEELNSVMEQMPPLAQAIADGMGITVGQLRAVAAEGQLTSKAVLAALLSQKDAIESQFTAMMGGATTMSNLMSRADNAMMMLIGRADELGGATQALQGAFAAVVAFLESADTATTMAVAFEKLGQAIQIMVGVFAAALPYLDEFFGVWLAGKGLVALAAFGFNILSTVKTVGFLTTALTTVATAMGATTTQVAQLSAQMAVLGRMATIATVVSGILGAVTAIGMLVAGFFLFRDTTTSAQKAANDYNASLDKLGGTAEDVASKFKALNAEQQKGLVQQTGIAVTNNQAELKKQEQALKDRIDALISNKYSPASDDSLPKYMQEYERFTGILEAGGKGMAAYIEHLKKSQVVSEAQYQALVKQNTGLESQREAVAKLEAQLRIITNTRRGDEEEILGHNAALSTERDNLAKNTEEWAKYLAKLRESATTHAMSPKEQVISKGQQLNQSPQAIAAAVGLAELAESYKKLDTAIKASDASEAARLRTVIAATEASHLQAVRVEAVAGAIQTYNAAGMDSWEVIKKATDAGQQAMDAEKKRLDVMAALGRIERENAEARESAFRAGSLAAQQSIEHAEKMAAAWMQGSKAAREMEAELRAVERAKKENVITTTGQVVGGGALNIEALVQAIIRAESGGNPNAVSPAGAKGLMQLMPGTASWLGFNPNDMFDPTKNVEAGTKYIKYLLSKYAGNVISAVAAYNAGQGTVDDYLAGTNKTGKNPNLKITENGVPPFKETEDYYRRVLKYNNEIVLKTQELAELDKQALATGAQKYATLKEQTDLVKVQADLLKGQYSNVKTDAMVIPADKIKAQMDALIQSYQFTRQAAAEAVVEAIKSTQGITDAKQAELLIQTSITAAIEKHKLAVAGAAIEEEKQTAAIEKKTAMMQAQIAALDGLKNGPVALNQAVDAIGLQIDGGITKSKAVVESYFALVESLNVKVKELLEKGLGTETITQQVTAMTRAFNAEQLKKITDIGAGLDQQAEAAKKAAPSWAQLTGEIKQNAQQLETEKAMGDLALVSIAGQTDATLALAEAKKKDNIEKAKAIDTQNAYNDAMGRVAKSYLDSLTPQEKYAAKLKEIERDEKALLAHKAAFTGEEWERMQRGLAKAREEAEGLRDAADPMAKIFDEAAKNIYNAWTGMFESLFTGSLKSFSDLVDSIKTMFLKMLAQMAAQALAKPILLPIMQTMGVGGATINNLFGAGTVGLGAANPSSGGGLMSNLSSGFGLFGPGGIGSTVGGVVSGLGGLLGSSGMAAGGAMMSNLGLIPGISQAFSAGLASLTTGATSIGAGMIASAAIPIVGALAAIAGIMGAFSGPTPHPSSIAVAGGSIESKHGPDYMGKGNVITGASGMPFGYNYGHTDPKDAMKLRDSLMEVDKALFALIPTAKMAEVNLGMFGKNAEGWVAGLHGQVADAAEMTAYFIKDWVAAAAKMGAVQQSISDILHQFTGTAEDVLKGLGGLMQMNAYVKADPKQDVAAALAKASQTPSQALAGLRADLEKLAGAFDGSAQAATALGAASANLYQSELQMISAIQSAVSGISASFGSSIEEIKLSVMDAGGKYAYFQQQAEGAFAALQTATDPTRIAAEAEKARSAAMQAYGLLSDDQKREQAGAFQQFLADAQKVATDKLNTAQQTVVDQHAATAKLLGQALSTAGNAAAEALKTAGDAAAGAITTASSALAAIASRLMSSLPASVPGVPDAPGMAGGGIVPGTWNGRSGIAGDSVLTALTPGEAVIPRAMTRKHAALIDQIMADQVGYAAYGQLPGYGAEPGSAADSASGQAEARRAATSGAGLGNSADFVSASIADAAASLEAAALLLSDPLAKLTQGRSLLPGFAESVQRVNDNIAQSIDFIKNPKKYEEAERIRKLEEALKALEAERIQYRAGVEASGGDTALVDELYRLKKEATVKASEGPGGAGGSGKTLEDFMQGIDRALADLDLSEFQKQLQSIQDQMRANIKEATDLGATEVEFSRIRELAAKQTAAASAEQKKQLMEFTEGLTRELDSLDLTEFQKQLRGIDAQLAANIKTAQQYEDSAAAVAVAEALAAKQKEAAYAEQKKQIAAFMQGLADASGDMDLTEFQKQLRGIQDQMDANIETARNLEAGLAGENAARELAAKQTAAAYAKQAQQLGEFIAPYQTALDEQGLSDGVKQLNALNRELAGLTQAATALGADAGRLNILKEAQGIQAAALANQAFQDATDKSKQALDALQEKLKGLVEAIQQSTRGIDDAILNLRRKDPDFDEAGYQSAHEAQKRAALATAMLKPDDYEGQISAVNDLRAALTDRYAAEEAAITRLTDSARRLADIAKQLRDYVASLKVSDLSTLDPEKKLQEARSQYEGTLAKAQGGDIEAASALQGKAQAYLEQARGYFASSTDYAAIFDRVTSALTGFADASSSVSAEAAVKTQAEQKALALQTATIEKLEALKGTLREIEARATADTAAKSEAERQSLTAEINKLIAALQASGLSGTQAVVAAITGLRAGMTAAATASAASSAAAAQAAAAQVPGGGGSASAPAATGPIADLYQSILGRAADASGLAYWTGRMDSGASVADLTAAFRSSAEYQALPRHAAGGLAKPGWAMVGEEGPELVNFSQPGRVYTAQDTTRMLSDNDRSEDTEAVVIELKALVRLQSAANRQLIAKLEAVESRLAGMERSARLEASA